MQIHHTNIILAMTTLELIAYWQELTNAMKVAVVDDMEDALDDVELELIRRDDVPEEHFALIDQIQEDWTDDEDDSL